MTKQNEPLINTVTTNKPNYAERLEPKGTWVVVVVTADNTRTRYPSVERRSLTHRLLIRRNTVSPYSRPAGQADRKEG